ncbi:interleukin-1 receptor-associated kinase 4 [Latimeria chalumnae]|uniref:interleukin-1 receptor-associated kinase 4 n=1 Tax=Latimeria chalumnae TaxID=7897 RepID=UPI00313E9313
MSKPITSSMYVRCLNHGLIRQLADFLDPQDAWKTIAVAIKKPTGEPRYNQFHIRRFEGLVHAGKSPTCELLFDWGTTNCKVGDLVDLLIRNQLLAAASLLLPDAVGAMPSSRIPLESQPTLPFHEKETVLVPNMTEPQFPTPDSTSDHKSSGADCDTGFYNFSFHELMKITSNFDERPLLAGGNKLGEGGFGVVYRGCLNNKVVAVKKLTAMPNFSFQELRLQFDQEIKTMAKCQHENLVEMIGFSNDGDHSCLIYAYMPNGSLLDRLACLDGTAPLSWSTRCNITWGTANGIKYLHDNNHIHRDIKSANILLNDLFVPKISDFGLARASAQLTQTVMTEKIVGTAAYMAPEALRGEVTPKSDVFSFGVVLLEIITGLSAVDENREPQLLLDIKEEIEDEEMTLEDYIDKKMETWDSAAVEKVYSIACQCLHERKNKRPDIKSVCELLQA